MVTDMTKGSEFRHIFRFAIPLLFGQLFQQMYNMVDRVVVGKFVGEDAIGAVGTAFPVMFFAIALVMGITMGASTVISQLYGAKQFIMLKRAASTILIFLAVSSAVVAVFGFFIAKPLLVLLQTDSAIIEDATLYLKIIFVGMPAMFAYNVYGALLRGLGNSKIPTFFLIIATILNIFLDLLFVIYFNMGVAGVAIATVLSQLISAVLCLIYVYKSVDFLAIRKGEWVFDREMLAKAIKLGIPSGIQQTVLSMGFMALQGLTNSYGKEMTSAITITNTIESLGTLTVMNFGMALTTFTAQNVGAGEFKRVGKGLKSVLLTNLVISGVTFIVLYFFAADLMNLFMPVDTEATKRLRIIGYGIEYLQYLSYFIMLIGSMFAFSSLLRGAGDVMVPLASTLSAMGFRILMAYTLSSVPTISYAAIWISMPFGWTISLTIGLIRYYSGKWKSKGIVKSEKVSAA